ncbi:hypothetical protein Tco_0835230, partial [Tanacetum coccineum]
MAAADQVKREDSIEDLPNAESQYGELQRIYLTTG